ncbi:MAG: hypothetical protein U1E78_01845 [Gammaproteobacteria bacterium]
MKYIPNNTLSQISGGEIIPGYPSQDMICTDMKLLVSSGIGEPGFDIRAAAKALLKQCGSDFGDPLIAHQYVLSGGVPI